ncbi:hypothetical protein [Rhizobium sp. PDO1-076]|nr:hypothetical protein [Rhizobium sp. PDO1-076]
MELWLETLLSGERRLMAKGLFVMIVVDENQSPFLISPMNSTQAHHIC